MTREGGRPTAPEADIRAQLSWASAYLSLDPAPHPLPLKESWKYISSGPVFNLPATQGPTSKELGLGRGDDGQTPMASATVWPSLAVIWGPVSVPPMPGLLLCAEWTSSLAPSHRPGVAANGTVVWALSQLFERSHAFHSGVCAPKER